MTTPVIITLIIVGGLVAISAINTVGDIIKRKNDAQITTNAFKKVFNKENK